MEDHEMETFDGGSGAEDTHNKTKTEADDGTAHVVRQQGAKVQETDNGYGVGTGHRQLSPSQQRAGEREADEDTRMNSAAESRIQTDDGRAHMARQTVRHDPRSDSIRSVDIAPPRLELASRHLSPVPSVPEIAPFGAGDPIKSADHDAKTDDGRPHMLRQGTVPVPTGRPHISLCQAAQDGKIEIVRQWLQYNRNQPNRNHYSDKHGLYPIHYAAKFNQPEIMELLCSKEEIADVCATTITEGYTPLHLAARYNPYNIYESATREDTDSAPDPGNYSSYTLPLRRQMSIEAAMKFLVKIEKVNVNAGDRYGITPLHLACQVGNVEGVKVLLTDERIKLDAKDGNGDTPLHEACFHGKEMITIMLLEKMKKTDKIDLTITNDLGLTPFHLACREGHLSIANHLLHATDDPSKLVKAMDNEGATPLHLACQNDNNEIVSILLKHKANVFARTNYGVTPVHVAAQHGCLKVMHTFFDDPQYTKEDVVDVTDNYNQTPLHFAAENGWDEMMRLLLDKGAKKEAMDIDHYTPLLTAAEFGRRSCFKVLLEHDADIEVQNKDRKNAVFLASESNHPEILEDIILLRHGSEGKKLLSTPDILLNTPLHVAAEKGNLESLSKLLECSDIKTYAKNVLGKTAMHLAAEKGHLHIVTELEEFCPEIAKSTDENGDTPLHLACSCGFVEVAEHLIKGGADIEARNAVRRTPIGCAAFYGHARVIELLVSSKANIDTMDKLKTTPLQLAAKEGHVTAVETLLKHQASMTSLDQRKFNALDWAIENGHSDVAEAIIKSSKWRSALINYTRAQDGEITSPFRKLIQRMPGVAEMVLNKCTDTNADRNIRPDSEDFAVTFYYQFIEDREQAELWKEETDAEKQSEDEQKEEKKWFSNSWKLKHPMRVMVESKRTELLKHPLVYKLIEDKWSTYGRGLFYTGLIFHMAFVIFLMAFALILLNPFSPTCVMVSSGQFGLTQPGDQVSLNVSQLQAPHNNITATYLTDMSIAVTDGIAIIDGYMLCFNVSTEVRDAVSTVLSVGPICGQCGLSSSEMMFLEAAAVLIILYSIIQLCFEALFFSQQLYMYLLDIATWVNVPLYIFAIAFVSVFGRECLCPIKGQWQVGIVAVFLVWAHLILNMRRMRVLDTGIYVLMFKNIFIRFLKLTILTVLLLLMFALTFFMTFRQFHSLFVNSPFANPGHSILKTIAMSIGDLGYDELFRQPTGGSSDAVPGIPFPEISYILWIMFIILIPILFSNLLVGLAVDDIKGILEAAALTRLTLRVELVLSLEDRFQFLQHFSVCFRDKLRVRKLTVQPHKDLISSKILSPVIRLLRGENYTSAEHISHVLNPTKTPIEQQTQTLMREISKIQETLKEIPKMQEAALCKLLNQAAQSKPSSRSRVVPN